MTYVYLKNILGAFREKVLHICNLSDFISTPMLGKAVPLKWKCTYASVSFGKEGVATLLRLERRVKGPPPPWKT